MGRRGRCWGDEKGRQGEGEEREGERRGSEGGIVCASAHARARAREREERETGRMGQLFKAGTPRAIIEDATHSLSSHQTQTFVHMLARMHHVRAYMRAAHAEKRARQDCIHLGACAPNWGGVYRHAHSWQTLGGGMSMLQIR
jgi:hypothetical protein